MFISSKFQPPPATRQIDIPPPPVIRQVDILQQQGIYNFKKSIQSYFF